MNTLSNIPSDSIVSIIKSSYRTFSDEKYTEYEPIILTYDDPRMIKNLKFDWNLTKDALYYRKVWASLDHLVFKWDEGWIKSRRQLILTSEDCMSAIHLVPNEDSWELNVFQRSSNIDNALQEDIAFLCDWLQQTVNSRSNMRIVPLPKIRLFISIPHTFGNQLNKVENGL